MVTLSSKNDANSFFISAMLAADGVGIDKDEDFAEKLFGIAFREYHRRREHDPEAMFYLGEMYWNGYGTERNDQSALNCFIAAAKGGSANGIRMIGDTYARGLFGF